MIRTVPHTGSTSGDLLARLGAGEPVPEGEWLVADRQTAGRGRHGRTWSDGAGNFMGSTVVHPAPGDPDAPSLALVAGLAVHAAVLPHAGDARLKWPNDVLVGHAKLAGVLLERAPGGVVVGIGVNLVQAPQVPGRETASLGPGAPDRDAFAETLARAFAGELARWRQFGLAATIARWQAAAVPLGTELSVAPAGEPPLSGRFAGLDETGALRLALADGTTRIVHSGEVLLA